MAAEMAALELIAPWADRAPSRASSEESEEVMSAAEALGQVKYGSPEPAALEKLFSDWEAERVAGKRYQEDRAFPDYEWPTKNTKEDDDAIPDYRTLMKQLDSETDNEVALEKAKRFKIDVDRLAERDMVAALVDSLECVQEAPLKELCEKCERLGLASHSTLPKEGLRRTLHFGLIWDELNVSALREECEEKGLGAEEAKMLKREELLAWLADSTWEAWGVPVRRFNGRHDARLALVELRREDCSSPEMLEKRCEQLCLPAGLPEELLRDWMKKIVIWKWLPVRELRSECLDKGLMPEEPPQTSGLDSADVERNYYLTRLIVALRRERCQAAGVSYDRVGGLPEAEHILQEVDRHKKLDVAALRAEAAKLDLPLPKEVEETEKERQALLRLLKDVLIWSRLPLESLRGECRERDVVFPEVFAPAQGDIPKDLFVAGSWNDYVPVKMNKVGSTKFRHTLEIGEQGPAHFQLLLTSENWSTVLYPSVEDANPHVAHCVLGPNSEGHGKNWCIGVHPNDAEFAKPGAKCTILVSFENDLPTVSWDTGSTVSSILSKRPITAAQTASQRPQATAPRQFKSGERRDRWERVEPAKKQAIKELVRQEALLRSLKAEGILVQWFDGLDLKRLLDQFKELDEYPQEELLTWYKDCGFPIEADLERKELLWLIKRFYAWRDMPLNALKEECERLEHFPNSLLDESHKEGTEEEQKGYFVDRLLDQDRMAAWQARGYQARQIGCVDTVISMIGEMERIKALPFEELRELWVSAALPEEEFSTPKKEQVFATLKKLLVWVNLDLPALQSECRESGLPINADGEKGMTDDQLKQDLLVQLKVGRFLETYEARRLPVKSLGLTRTSQLLGDLERYKTMDLGELRASYEGEQNFLPADTPRETLLSFLQDVSVWEALSIKDLLDVAEERGIPMDGFRLVEPIKEKDPAVKEHTLEEALEAKLREDLVDRLILREHLMPARRTGADRPILLELCQPNQPVAQSEAAEPIDACKNPAVWKLIEQMRDPFIAEHIAGVARKELPKSARLPASASHWLPMEAALHVLSHGKFDPDTHGRKAGPSGGGGPSGRPLLSVVCPTSEGRQHFHKLLYECYKKQDYEPKELVVVDSGTRRSEFFTKKLQDDSVFYHFFDVEDSREDKKSSKVAWSLGLKRNIACCLSHGDVLAHFDDDDLYATGYLSWMQRELCATAGDDGKLKPVAAKLTEWYLLDLNNLSFRYLDVFTDLNVPPRERRGWLYGWGFSYIFTRSAWELAPFPDVEFAEDIAFLEGLMAENVKVRLVELPLPVSGAHGAGRVRTGNQLPEALVAHSCHAGSTSGGEFDGRKRSGRQVACPTGLQKHLALVKDITNAQRGPVIGPRQTVINRFGSGMAFGGAKAQQPTIRIGGAGAQLFPSFGLAPNLRPGAKSAAR